MEFGIMIFFVNLFTLLLGSYDGDGRLQGEMANLSGLWAMGLWLWPYVRLCHVLYVSACEALRYLAYFLCWSLVY